MTGPGAVGWAGAVLLGVCLLLRVLPWARDPDGRYHALHAWFF